MKNLKSITYNLKPSRGFTLVEMLVSISVFMVVMTVAAGSLANIIDGNAKAQSLKSAINNLNFALESMGKNIRVGTNYTCSVSDCSKGDTSISFKSYKNEYVTYKYKEYDSVNKTGSIERCVNTATYCDMSSNNFIRLTAPEVKITDMKFYIPNISLLPQRVLIIVSGYTGVKDKVKTEFNLQTTVSQRSF